jgi:hypothetical protein
MFKKSSLTVITIVFISLSGCSRVVKVDRPRVPKVLDRDAVNETFSIQYAIDEFEKDYKRYKTLVLNGDDASLGLARILRDVMIDRIRVDVELNYREYEARLFAGRAAFDSVADFLELGLALATTISNGERVKTVLGAVSTAFKGNRLSINKNFFRERTIEAIVSKMQESREKVKARILRNMLEASVKNYSFEAGWTDLVEFFYAGTLQSGLQALTADAGTAAARAKARTEGVEQLRIASLQDLEMIQKIRAEHDKLEAAWATARTNTSPQAVAASNEAITKARQILKRLDPDSREDLPEREVLLRLRSKISESLDDRSKLVELMEAYGIPQTGNQ